MIPFLRPFPVRPMRVSGLQYSYLPPLPPGFLFQQGTPMMRWWLAILFFLPASHLLAAEPTPAQVELFEKKIRPILADNCYSCHGPKKQSGGLRLDSAADLKAGIDGKPVVVAGEPGRSKL